MAASVASVGLKSILVALDLSPRSQLVLDYAALIARHHCSKIIATHILYYGSPFPYDEIPPSGFQDVGSARRSLESMLSSKLPDVEHEVRMSGGDDAPKTLQAIASEYHVDLIVAGTQGRKGLKKLVAGSVAESLLRRVNCPVMTIGPLVSGCPATGSLHHILVATDFSSACARALSFSCEWSRTYNAGLTILHVCEESEVAASKAKLQCCPEAGIEKLVETGDVAERIARVAEQKGSGLITMALHPESPFLASHLGRTVVHRVITSVHCPVLTFPCTAQSPNR
ncbi:MAG: universal stress protein [Terriglobia bacterium]|jgi:nucleotide-binding universal stress UspA family protein|nr:universal stress protein [Terriglobia bacterium]